MLKILGSVLLFGACTALGLAAQQRLERRLRAIDSVLSALAHIAAELQCRLTPLPTIIELLAVSPDYTVATLFSAVQRKLAQDNGQSLPYKWCMALRECREDVGLMEEEIGILCDMATFLGQYDVQQQVKNLTYVRERLSQVRAQVYEETRVRGRLYRTCGAAIGVMAVLILI